MNPRSIFDRRSSRTSQGTALLVFLSLLLVTSVAVASASTPERTIWTRRYNGPAGGFDGATTVAVSPDGSTVFVTGLSVSSTSYHYATLAYDVST
ncbi:MAG: hypothetical protein M3P18_21565 [Actinomycetota bacterium]|nr:hypothetical protein [Actinomycetota bacterium]